MNPYDDIIAESQLDAEDLVFYSIGPNEYHIYSLRENKVTGLGKEVISKKEYDEYKIRVKDSKRDAKRRTFFGLADTDKSITNYAALDGWTVVSDNYEGTVIDSRTISGASSLTYYCSTDVSKAGKTYACSVVALCNLMKYYKMRGYVNTSSYRYLQIADGWNSYLRYINFNGYDYYRKNGWSFSLSK